MVRRCVVVALVGLVVVGVLVVVPPVGVAVAAWGGVGAAPVGWVATGGVVGRARVVAASERAGWSAPAGPVWPRPGVAVVDVSKSAVVGGSAAAAPVGVAGLVRAGSLPVWVGRVGGPGAGCGWGWWVGHCGGAVVGRVRVVVADAGSVAAVGVRGLLVSVSRVDGVGLSGAVEVGLDFSGFAEAFGAGFSSRVRLVSVVGCVWSGSSVVGCAGSAPVASARVDGTRGLVRGRVVVGGDAGVAGSVWAAGVGEGGEGWSGAVTLALVSGVSGEEGDFGVSPLGVAGSWAAGVSGGEFSYGVPVRVVPAAGGLAPSVGLSYSSGAVDGRTNASGGQSSWVGEGWGLEPGFIERSFRSCADDVATGVDGRVYVGDGSGGFSGAYSTPAVLWDADGQVFSGGDFSGDGHADVLYRDGTDETLFLARGDGVGGWLSEPRLLAAGSWAGRDNLFSPGDFTGDGHADVIYRDLGDSNLYLRAGVASGIGLAAAAVQIGSGWGGRDVIFSPGDFNGDGHADVLSRRASDGVLFATWGNGSGGWLSGASVQIGSGWTIADRIFAWGDFNGDGHADVLYRRGSNSFLYGVWGNGSGGWVSGASVQIGTGWGAFAALAVTGDFGGDGDADVFGTRVSAANPYYPNPTGDRCWRQANATLSWGGRSGELVRDDVSGVWRLAADDGTRVELLTGAGNGDSDGEYWKLTAPDGVQYFFGRHKLPGWVSGQPVTNAAFTVPVFANHSGEPCFVAGNFAWSRCAQAWRWNLDHVIDPSGNALVYWYTKESNLTGLAGDPAATNAYDRGGALVRIDYGLRVGSELSGQAGARVVFDLGLRCVSSCGSEAAPVAANWPDTPWDLRCTAPPCTNNVTPSFWTAKRLAVIRTQVWAGSGWQEVDRYSLTHDFPATTDGTSPSLWLASLSHTGSVGGSVSTPTMLFGGTRFANRSDYNLSLGVPQVFKYRLTSVDTGAGGQVLVDYEGSGCTPATEPDPDQNTYRCFPQYYYPPGAPGAGWSWWNKHRVTQLTERDNVAGSPDVEYRYAYSTAGSSSAVLWGHDRGGWVGAPLAQRSWSSWRGYPTVTITTGNPAGVQSSHQLRYFRGLHADRTDAGEGTRLVTVSDSEGAAVTDELALAGFLREEITHAVPGGAALSGVIYDPWQAVTATRSFPPNLATPFTHQAGYTRVGAVRSRQWLAHNSSWRRAQTETSYDPTYANPVQVDDGGDTAVAGDETCTRTTFTPNTSVWITAAPARVETVAVACAVTPTYPGDLLADTRLFYDGATTHGTAPTAGLVTLIQRASGYTAGAPVYATQASSVYDGLGRPTQVRDGLDRLTATAYTPPGAGPLTQVAVTNPAGHTTTTLLQPAWGLPLTVTDPNNKTTTASYDPLGRLLGLWRPGRALNLTPNLAHTYTLHTNAPSYTTTAVLNPAGGQVSSYQILDGLLRARQRQTPAPQAVGGRVITDHRYDSRGLPVTASLLWNATNPSSTLASFTDADTPRQTRRVYDGVGRVVSEQLWALGAQLWAAGTGYDGDRTLHTPPAGGTATTTITDVRGRVTHLRQHTATPTPSGAYQATGYTYDNADRLTAVTDPAGNTWTYTYDLRGRLTAATDPDRGATSHSYDNAGQRLSSTDARGITLAHAYDSLGRVTSLWQDAVGTGTQHAAWVYDTLALGQLSSATRLDNAHAYTTTITGYDDAYRILGQSVTFPPAEGALSTQGPWVFTATYHVDGSPATQTLPSGGGLPAETITTGYDSVGYPTTQTGLDAYLAEVSYYPWGPAYQSLHGAAGARMRLTTTRDPATDRLATAAVHTEDPTSPGVFDEVRTDTYSHDPAGNLSALNQTLSAAVVSGECFGYDRLRRLTDAWTTTTGICATPTTPLGGPDPYRSSWTHDSVGNRTSHTRHGLSGAADTITAYTYPSPGGAGPHQLTNTATTGPGAGTSSYSYDPAGHTTSRNPGTGTQTLTWNPEGHLGTHTIGAATTSYLYGTDGTRLLRRDPDTSSTAYLPAGTELTQSPAGVLTATRHYGNIASRTPAGLTWLAADHHHSAHTAIDAATQAVTSRRLMPYGEPRGTPPLWPNEKTFVAGTADPTGLTHLGAREYDPTIGRFLSVDPIMDLTDPQQWHGYTYANNNPTTNSDPDGLLRLDPTNDGGCDATCRRPNHPAEQDGLGRPSSMPTELASTASMELCLDPSCHLPTRSDSPSRPITCTAASSPA